MGLNLSMKNLKGTWVLGVLLLAIVSCNKNEPVADSNVWLPAELKSYFLFYPGSYWVMEMPGTDFVDSLFILSTRLDTQTVLHPGSRQPIGLKEKLSVLYFSPFYGRRFLIEAEGQAFCGQRANTLPCFRITKKNLKGNSDTVVHESIIAYFPFEANRILPAKEKGTDVLFASPKLATYNQLDSTFTNVWRLTVDLDQTEQNQLSVRHFAPGIGLIRWQVPEFGFNWLVRRYATKQTP
jgi:hypothetical protein